MDCKDIAALLSGLVDGTVPAETRHEAERHLAGCAACSALVDQAESIDVLVRLDADQVEALPPGFAAGVIEQTIHAAHRAGPSGRLVTISGWLAAAAAFTLAVTVWVLDRTHGVLAPGPAGPGVMTSAAGAEAGFYQVSSLARSMVNEEAQPREAFVGDAIGSVSRAPDEASAALEREMITALVGDLRRGAQTLFTAFERIAERMEERPMPVDVTAPIGVEPRFSRLKREDAETLYATSGLLEALLDADTTDLRDVEMIRRIALYDEILVRLERTRERLDPADRAAVIAAESILHRIVHGPISVEDLDGLRETVESLELYRRIDAMSERGSDRNTL